MPRVCTICTHPQRGAIDAALLAGGSFRNIAQQFAISPTALFRHRGEHIPAALAQAQEATEVAQADDLLAQLRDLQRRTLGILSAAEGAADGPTALRAIGEARKNLELLARLLGELQDGPTINVLISTEWQQLRGRIVVALTAFPDARLAIAEVLDAAG